MTRVYRQLTPALRDKMHHMAETARQVCVRAALLRMASRFYGASDTRLEVERRVLRLRALRLERLAAYLGRSIEELASDHARAQYRFTLAMARAEARLRKAQQEGDAM